MAIWRAQVELNWISGLPGDKSVNVWHCTAPGLSDAEDFAANVIGFYQSIQDRFGNFVIDGGFAHQVKLYALADPEPRAPASTIAFIMDVPSNTMPPELAICLSFQGERISGEDQRKRRGRVYLGPLSSVVNNNDGRVAATAINDITTAAGVLLSASGAWDWVVYSPTDNGTVLVTNGWVDNEFDVQRRRGLRPTVRTTF